MAPIIVLAGGLSHERDVSLRSGRRVSRALRSHGHEVIEADMNADLVGLLRANPGSVVVLMLHGGLGEDGAVRQVLELLDVPFVGSSAQASRLAFDKSTATPLVAKHATCPAQVALPHEVFRELGAAALVAALRDTIGLPLIVKPSRGGSALGVTKVTSEERIAQAIAAAYAYGPVAVVEQFIGGVEVAVTVLDLGDGPVALPAVEIRPVSGFYDYSSRYTAGETEFVTPAELDDDVSQAVSDLALAAHNALGLADLSRIDIVVDETGVPHFIEANVAPGMTDTSLAPLAIEAAGLDLGAVFSALVQRCSR